MASVEQVIAPPRRGFTVDWGELWRYRDLFLVLAWRDVAVRYKQAVLGFLWAILQPLVTMVVFTFVFNGMGKIESGDGSPYPLFLYVGLLLWQLFSGSLVGAANSMVANAGMIQKVYFPRLILPVTAVTTSLVDLAAASVVLAGMMIYYRFVPGAVGLLILPLLILATALVALGFGLFTAALNVRYRDVRHAVPFVVQVMMFVTPVVYPVTMLDGHPLVKSLMLWLNPMTGIVTNSRAAILGNSPVDWGIMGISLVSSAVVFVLGLWYFRATESYFADMV